MKKKAQARALPSTKSINFPGSSLDQLFRKRMALHALLQTVTVGSLYKYYLYL